ncbi:HNH endonuclease family protein (plasmid) [Streptomyces yangpuensis]|uniref:HNH endonuclease family protein n=1 Tax=Streptomyces yangpuensis TaxID=1648182 RepID=A0ABY5Q8N0_9ACTN|nr:HNH endonuclease family protein [Streptomyces yangpuensis]UUY52363.1 HNH endonuclease family protein [Streptomyces yangpuensis]
MITNLMRRGLPALALAVLPLFAPGAPVAGATTTPSTGLPTALPGVGRLRAPVPLFEAIDRIAVADEQRAGYKRDLYKHWNKGLNAGDGCDTRKEVILAEAVLAPQIATGCKLTGGSWRSPYDNVVVTDAARLDVDHFVPLAEVHDSGGFAWGAVRREAYANDQASPDTLIAVSAASNRSKSDKDPAEWLPSDGSYHCTYVATWVGTKLRWNLTADEAERQALLDVAEYCPTTTVVYESAP